MRTLTIFFLLLLPILLASCKQGAHEDNLGPLPSSVTVYDEKVEESQGSNLPEPIVLDEEDVSDPPAYFSGQQPYPIYVPGFGSGGGRGNDRCPNDPDKTEQGICGCGKPDTDEDNDGLLFCFDNCPSISNEDQADEDNDGVGAVCDCNDADNSITIPRGNEPSGITCTLENSPPCDIAELFCVEGQVECLPISSICVNQIFFSSVLFSDTLTIPNSITSHDLNGDNIDDVILTSANGVTIFHNLEPGQLVATSTEAVGTDPRDVAAGDIDGDGDIDIVAANGGSNNITVLFNNMDSYSTKVNYPSTGIHDAIALSDVDGDDDLDILVSNANNDNISLLKNNGMGVFDAPINFAVGVTPIFLAVADMNHDDSPDIIVANSMSDNISVLLNDGTGNFLGATNYSTGTSPNDIVIADMNGDGNFDAVVVNGGDGTVQVWLGNSMGQLTLASTSAALGIISVDVTDLDHDLDIDVVAGTSSSEIIYFLNNGVGTLSIHDTSTVNGGQTKVAVGRFDFNNNADIVFIGSEVGLLALLLDFGVNKFPKVANYATGDSPVGVALGKLDNDQDIDMVVVNNASSTLQVYLNNGSGIFGSPTSYATGTNPNDVKLGDVDNDNDLDIVVANRGSNTISIFLNAGNGTFTLSSTKATGSIPLKIAINKINNDAFVDIAVSHQGDLSISVFINDGDGDGSFASQATYAITGGSEGIAIGDLNGDTFNDVIAVGNDKLHYLQNNTTGGFLAAVTTVIGGTHSGLAIGDLDDDNDLDLILNVFNSTSNRVYLNNGSASFSAQQFLDAQESPNGATIADLDSDGDLDFINVNEGSLVFAVSAYLNNGQGTFSPPVFYHVGQFPANLALGDVDGDNDLDLAVVNYDDDTVSILTNITN